MYILVKVVPVDGAVVNIFEVTNEDIEKLSDTDLRQLVGYLVEQEVRKFNHSPAAVTYGGHQNAKDGGIDVRVNLTTGAIGGYVPKLQTGFQVKAEDMPPAEILKEMKPKKALRTSIVELGKQGGAYIIVSSKGTLADTQLNQRRNAMAKAVSGSADAEQLYLDFYDRRRIATWVNQHPGLIPWVCGRTGRALSGWHPFGDWSSSPGEVTDPYLLDGHVRLRSPQFQEAGGALSAEDGIDRIREILRRPHGAVRLVGLSGVGKTRFVQALFDDRVGKEALSRTSAVYTDVALSPDPTPLDLVTRLHDLSQECVIIVDNCGVELHRRIAASVKGRRSKLSLITIEYDISDDEPEGTDVFILEAASSEIIELILKKKHPNLSEPERSTIASFSEGNSRIALALADTAQTGESLANLKDGDLFKRLFRQRHEDNPALLRAAKVCALVHSFDVETRDGEGAELPLLAAVAGQPVDEFYSHVAELLRRQLIQQRSTWRAFLPHALAHRLAKQALEEIHYQAIKKPFLEQSNERFIKSFSRRLGCLHDSQKAQQIVSDWLGPNGWLAQTGSFNAFGITVLTNIAPVAPKAAIGVLRASAQWAKDNEQKLEHIDRIAGLLHNIAYDPALFDEAASLLADLVDDDNSSPNGNEALTVFLCLFQLYLSGTHALIKQRVALILRLASSHSPSKRSLAIKGLDSLLESYHFSSHHQPDFGARKRDYGWLPKSTEDVREWYATVFSLCMQLESMSLLKSETRTTFGKNMRLLAESLDMTDEVIEVANKFSSDEGWPEGWAAARGAYNSLRKSKRKRPAEAAKYRALADRLKPLTLAGRIASYVLPERWSPLDVSEVDFDDEKRYEKAEADAEKICAEIGVELARENASLLHHLPALLKCKSPRVISVFSAVARSTVDTVATWRVVADVFASLPEGARHDTALCGYILGLEQVDADGANAILEDALERPELHPSIVRLSSVNGVSPLGAARLMRATSLSTVPGWTFAFLQSGRACDNLSGAQFRSLLSAIASRQDAFPQAVAIMGMRIFSRKSDKKGIDSDDRAAGRALLSQLSFSEERRRIEDDQIGRIAQACIIAPDHLQLAEQLCEKIQATMRSGWRGGDYGELIEALATHFPFLVLDFLVEGVDRAHSRDRVLGRRYSERRQSPLEVISDEKLVEWANRGSNERFVRLAQLARIWERRKEESSEQNSEMLVWTTTARRLIEEATDPIPVLAAMVERFRPTSWSGSMAAILEMRIPLLCELEGHANATISEWAKNAMEGYLASIASVREFELKDSRSRDEKFDW